MLKYQPGELYVKQYKRIKYAKPDNIGIIIGKLPSRPIEKAMAGEGLLAQIVIDKYVDHLPLYRQMQRFERSGVKLSYSTLTDWVSDTCKLITPLFEALKAEVLQTGYLHADETPIKVLDKDKKDSTHRGYYWVYQNSISKIVFFDYQEGRGREGPTEILQTSKVIFRRTDILRMIFLIRKKILRKSTAWHMRGASLMMHWPMTRRLQIMPWRRYKNYIPSKEIAKSSIYLLMK